MTREEVIDFIKKLFDKDKGNTLNKVLKENKEIDDFLQKMVEDEPWFESKRKAFSCVARGILHKVICSTCGKVVPLAKAIYGGTHCSSKCSANDAKTRKKARETNLERYGAEILFASEEIKNKIRKTNIERYGEDNPFKNEQIQNKIKGIMLDKYGVKTPLQKEEFRQKQKQTLMDKYGVDNPLRSNEVQEKIIQTNLQRYGCKYVFQNEEVKKKSKKTLLSRYGVENPMQCEEIKDKAKQTSFEHYGVEFPTMSIEVKKKTVQTNLQRYGHECSLQNEEVQKKAKQTLMNKYGVDNSMQNEEIKSRARQTSFEHYGYEKVLQCPELIKKRINTVHKKTFERIVSELSNDVIPMFTEDEYIGLTNYDNKNEAIEYEWKCVHCGKVFKCSMRNISHVPQCPFCKRRFSSGEAKIFNLIKDNYSGEIVLQTRKVLPSGHELDIYIPEKKIAIEYNGLYWHSVENGRNKEYHILKSKECEEIGIHLIHVFENEWKENKDEISSFILDIIKNENPLKIFQSHNKLLKHVENGVFISRNFFNERFLIKSNCKILEIIEPQLHVFSIKNGKTCNILEIAGKESEYMTFYDCGGFIIKSID